MIRSVREDDSTRLIDGRRAPGRQGRVIGLGFAVLAAIAVLTGFETSPWFHAQVLESVSRRPQPFTELYFADLDKLPKHLSPGAANQFSFVIANHEGRAVDYTAAVVLRGPFGDRQLETNTIHVDSGRSSERAVQFAPDRAGAAYLVTVLLVGRPEIIHFLAGS